MNYLAILGPTGGQQIPANLHPIGSDAGGRLRFYGDEADSVIRFDGDAYVLGEFHRADAPVRRDRAPTRQAAPFARLIEEGWGSYVAFRPNGLPAGWAVLRDPSGTLPCYFLRRDPNVYIGSDAATVMGAAGVVPGIEWTRVAAQLLRRDNRRSWTCLRDLEEVPAGHSVDFGGTGAKPPKAQWFPPLTHPPDYPFDDAAERVRRTALSTIGASVASCGRLLVGVSGGLDSSIVAACLATVGADYACFTMYTQDPDGDEREYAAHLAARLGCKLISARWSQDQVDLGQAACAALPRPFGWPVQQSLDRTAAALCDAEDAEVIVRGTGGDAVFCYLGSAAPVVDRLMIDPLGVWSTTCDVARLNDCSVWTVSRKALTRLLRRRGADQSDDVRFLSADAVERGASLLTDPNSPSASRIPPGKREHVAAIASLQNAVEARLALPLPVCCPIYSQPMLETCLAIPTPDWVAGGRNRAVAREAFRDLLPAQILDRTLKGGPDTFAIELFRQRSGELRNRLLDGRLAAHGLLDNAAIEGATRTPDRVAPSDQMRLLALADAEAWANHWLG